MRLLRTQTIKQREKTKEAIRANMSTKLKIKKKIKQHKNKQQQHKHNSNQHTKKTERATRAQILKDNQLFFATQNSKHIEHLCL